MNFASAVEDRLRAALARPEPATLEAAARHLCLNTRAKRARPELVRRFGALLGVDDGRLVPVAVAAELIHSASLMHDDVIDEGRERRGAPSVNALYGNRAAVLGGDLLIALALEGLRPFPAAVTGAAVDAIHAMTRAAMWEIESARDLSLDEGRWRRIALGKTGALLAFCGRAAAIAADDVVAADAFELAAGHLGVAFQAADDLADLSAGTGKDRFADLRSGAPSVVIALASVHERELLRALGQAWSASDEGPIAAIGEALARGDVPRLVRARVAAEIESALVVLAPWLSRRGDEISAWASALLDEGFFLTDGSTPWR